MTHDRSTGKRLSPDDLRYIVTGHTVPVKAYIETGTLYGEQLINAVQVFKSVTGIELNPECVKRSQEAAPSAKLIQGDTLEELPKLCKRRKTPQFFYLDAHYFSNPQLPLQKGKFPLWEEMGIIRDRNKPDIVFVDDYHNFGVNRAELKQDPDAEEWESVTVEAVQEFFGDRVDNWEIIRDGLLIWLK